METISFEVRFKYYLYSEGYFNGAITFDKLKSAKAFKDVIDMCFKAAIETRYDSLSYLKGVKIIEKNFGAGTLESFADIYEVYTKETKL